MSPELEAALRRMGLEKALADHPTFTEFWIERISSAIGPGNTQAIIDDAAIFSQDVIQAMQACNSIIHILPTLPDWMKEELGRYSHNLAVRDSTSSPNWGEFIVALENLEQALAILAEITGFLGAAELGAPPNHAAEEVALAIAVISIIGTSKVPTHANYDAVKEEERPHSDYVNAVQIAFDDLSIKGNARYYARKAISQFRTGEFADQIEKIHSLLGHPVLGLKKV